MRPGRRLTRWVGAAGVRGGGPGGPGGRRRRAERRLGEPGHAVRRHRRPERLHPARRVLSARVIANATGSSKWRATSWQIGPNGACADHSDQSGNGKSATFNVTAPGTPGDYGATFTPRGDNNCGGEQGTSVSLVNGVRVTAPAPNPTLKSQCGLNVMLILDKSGSDRELRRGCPKRRAGLPDRAVGDRLEGLHHRLQHQREPADRLHHGHTADHQRCLQPVPAEPVQAERLDQLGGRLPAHPRGERGP